jgi:glutathione S-transferase
MVTLYHCKGARSLRPLWALEELGLDYKLEMLPFPPRVFAKEFLGINPLGTIPFFVDGPVKMTESSAICQYLVEKFGPTDLKVYPGESDYGAYLNWLYHSDATLTFPQTIVLRYTRLEPEARRLPQAVADYGAFFLGRLKLLDAALEEGRRFLVADRFTIADIAIGYALILAESLKLDSKFSDRIKAYLAGLKERPGYQRAAAKE